MTTRGGFIGRGGMGERGRIWRRKTHVLPFIDHAGDEALMVFSSRETCPLPPLYSFAMYFTHLEVSASNFRAIELLDAITKGTPLENYGCHFRVEIFFLPTSDKEIEETVIEKCITHYREEKHNRGDYTRQIEAFEAVTNTDTSSGNGTGNLPGLVPSYIDNRIVDYHHGLLYSYTGANWRTEKQPASRVRFDPIPQEEYAPLAEAAEEPEYLPPVRIFPFAMQESDCELLKMSFVGMHMFDQAHGETENVTNEPWQEAVHLGWSTW